jgi:hypothetical protein
MNRLYSQPSGPVPAYTEEGKREGGRGGRGNSREMKIRLKQRSRHHLWLCVYVRKKKSPSQAMPAAGEANFKVLFTNIQIKITECLFDFIAYSFSA